MFFSLASLAPGQIQHQHSTDTGNLFHSSHNNFFNAEKQIVYNLDIAKTVCSFLLDTIMHNKRNS